MKKVIFSQILVDNGVTSFSGLYDENGLPVTAELEKNDDGIVLTVFRKELSESEIQEICEEFEDCDICPLCDDCMEEIE